MLTKDSIQQFKRSSIINTLGNCQLFRGSSNEDLNAIADITVMKTPRKEEYLFHQGDPSLGFYIVQKGAISVHRVSPTGKEQVIHVFRDGESFAEATLATSTGYPADARALEPSHVLFVQKAGFLELVRKQPELALRMLASMSLHLAVLIGQLEDLTLKDVETRLANWLLKQCPNSQGKNKHQIILPMTKRLLAAELGTCSETFSRTLAKFRDMNFISVNGKEVTVQNPSRLKAMLQSRSGE